MKNSKRDPGRFRRLWQLPAVLFGLLVISPSQAAQFQLQVVGNDGNPVSGFRWLVQEDTTYAVDPNNPAPLVQQLSLNFHKSYHPIATAQTSGQAFNGNTDSSSVNVNDIAPGRYYVTVFPYSGYAMSGKPVTVLASGQDSVTVTVQKHPIPTAQISIFLFHDCFPLNGTPDLPEEEQGSSSCNPATVDFSRFRVTVEEPAGKYGQNGGPLLQNAFGDPLGTSYEQTCDSNGQNPGSGSFGCLDGDGAPIVAALGDGTISPNPDGTLIIRNLAPGKYGIIATPPDGDGWIQTSTIEGSPVIDAWVKANEPPFFVELGLPGPHVFIGFTQQRNDFSGGSASVQGRITNMHMSRPVSTELFSANPFPQCWVAVNDNTGGLPGQNLFAGPCNADSTFAIPSVPAGSYELKVFDKPLDIVIASLPFTVDPSGTCNGGQSCDFGDVPVFDWNNKLYTWIFNDDNQNGFWDSNEGPAGAESGPVNIRWRDGTVYQSFPTDSEGLAPFDEAFPWFHWMVAEVGFTTKKATGATVVVDAGGQVDTANEEFPVYGRLNPQIQDLPPCGGSVTSDCTHTGGTSRTETGPVLLEAFQGFLGQTNVMHFGKTDYLNFNFNGVPSPTNLPTYVGENGGITGVVFNTVTRAENDPMLAVGEGWEPGVPRVQVNLYADGDIDSPELGSSTAFPGGFGDVDWNGDGIYQADDNQIDDVDGDGIVTLADVDNYPLGWRDGGAKGPEDVDRDNDGNFDLGDAIAVAWTDSWDDNTPTGCQGQNLLTAVGVSDDRCFDGLRNWNQVRPGVFDGGYAFAGYDLNHLNTVRPAAVTKIMEFYDHVNSSVAPNIAATLQLGLLPSDYIVEATSPPGYKPLREHHKNVDFGDSYVPAPQALPTACVGPAQMVPELFAISTKDGSGDSAQIIPGVNSSDAAAPFAGEMRPVCDQKKVPLNAAQNAAADFFLVSDVPVAANISGIILNDLGNEFNPNSPNFGEKFAPPSMPIAFYDWNGKLVNRVYADENGRYNALVPSSWNVNLPQPSGVSPNVLEACMNDAGPIPDPANPSNTIVDPFFNPAFTQFCYTLQYVPGSTTYLDTPVLPVAAFSSPQTSTVDCEVPQRTPMIRDIVNQTRSTIGPFAVGGDRIQIRSLGNEQVPNPEWNGISAAPRFITRNYAFGGPQGNVYLEDANGIRTDISSAIQSWGGGAIRVDIPSTVSEGEYQVIVKRVGGVGGSGVESEIGVTLTIGHENPSAPHGIQGTRPNGISYNVFTVGSQGNSDFHGIQEAIDSSLVQPGDLLLVRPGEYDELVILWKPVKLQGWGAGSVTLTARQVPTNKIADWRAKIASLTDGNLGNGEISPLPGQAAAAAGVFQALGAQLFPTEEGAGIFVAGIDTTTPNNQGGLNRFNLLANRGARIDGFRIISASQGGGIVVNGYAPWLNIGNNRLEANAGFYGGGIRVGHPELTFQDPTAGLIYTDAENDHIRIHHNQVNKNGGIGENGFGGGLALYTGADQYRVQHNWICGNFTQGSGGGIAHVGLSNGGHIEHNKVLFNESFAQATAAHGGGIYIAGQTPLQAHAGTGLLLSDGSGNVLVNSNRIHGNLAGAGDGGAIAIVSASGVDIADNLASNSAWYDISLFNNFITNNVAGLAGAISIQDAVETHIVNNTVAHNDSTATTAQAFTPGFPNRSNAQPAGIVSRFHSAAVATLLTLVSDTDIPTNGGDLDGYRTFSDANLNNNIIDANRSFFWLNFDNPATAQIETGLFPANCTSAPTGCDVNDVDDYADDLAVLDGMVDSGEVLFARFNLLTNAVDNIAEYTGGGNQFTADPQFINPVFNEGADGLNVPEFTVLQTAGAFDEGGNFIQVSFGPLSLVQSGTNPNQRVFYDYHLLGNSPAVSAGQNIGNLAGPLGVDYDGDSRTNGNTNEIGADELP